MFAIKRRKFTRILCKYLLEISVKINLNVRKYLFLELQTPKPGNITAQLNDTSISRFTEKQAKILRDVKKKLDSHHDNKTDLPEPVEKAKTLYKSCLNSTATDELRFNPLFRLLKQYNLPRVPSLIADPESVDFQFDWVRSIAKIKRSLGADKLIGFEIFPDPKNRSEQFLAIGSPSTEDDLPL